MDAKLCRQDSRVAMGGKGRWAGDRASRRWGPRVGPASGPGAVTGTGAGVHPPAPPAPALDRENGTAAVGPEEAKGAGRGAPIAAGACPGAWLGEVDGVGSVGGEGPLVLLGPLGLGLAALRLGTGARAWLGLAPRAPRGDRMAAEAD
jgi:hypothetical protein